VNKPAGAGRYTARPGRQSCAGRCVNRHACIGFPTLSKMRPADLRPESLHRLARRPRGPPALLLPPGPPSTALAHRRAGPHTTHTPRSNPWPQLTIALCSHGRRSGGRGGTWAAGGDADSGLDHQTQVSPAAITLIQGAYHAMSRRITGIHPRKPPCPIFEFSRRFEKIT